MTQTLDYDHLPKPVPSIWLYRVALVCGIGPMIVGTLTFLAYLLFRDLGFAIFGYIVLLAGLAAVFVAGVCLAVYYFQSRHAGDADRLVARRNLWRAAVILIANFPLAGLYAGVGIYLISGDSDRAEVFVTNDDPAPTLVQLHTGADTATLGLVQPGQTTSAWIHFGNAGLTATLTCTGNAPTTQTVLDHLDEDTAGFGQSIDLHIKDGKLEFR